MKYGNIEYFVYVTVNIQRIYYSRMEGPWGQGLLSAFFVVVSPVSGPRRSVFDTASVWTDISMEHNSDFYSSQTWILAQEKRKTQEISVSEISRSCEKGSAPTMG